jgi:glycosyltransferase involved in cell wall biosynthesis
MRIQIYTQHYVPEVTAARYRVEAFAQRFSVRGHAVEVICPVPNHPLGVVAEGYGGRTLLRRRVDGVHVAYLRVSTKPAKTTRNRLAYYGSYAAAATAFGTVAARPDLILASSPPLPVAAAAASVAAARRVPWIFDVRDLWPLAAKLIGELTDPRALRWAERLERSLYRRADRIVTVTRPFRTAIAAEAGADKVELIPNGTTSEWLAVGESEVDRGELGMPEDRFVWTYAGNLGPSRRLEVAVEAANLLGDGYQLMIIGDGGMRAELLELAGSDGRASFPGLMPAEQTARYLRASDALYVPQQPSLGDFVPSKLYDCCAVGRPLIVAADGETRRLSEEADVAVAVEPGDAGQLAAAVRALREDPSLRERLASNGRAFAAEYVREVQADRLVDIAEALVQVNSRPIG